MTCAMCDQATEPMTPVLIRGRRELVCTECATTYFPMEHVG